MSTLCVSGYWNIHNKRDSNNYLNWFEKTLPLKCDFYFFGNDIELYNNYILKNRTKLQTNYSCLNIKNFKCYIYNLKNKNILLNEHYCPSIELWMIWMEKIN